MRKTRTFSTCVEAASDSRAGRYRARRKIETSAFGEEIKRGEEVDVKPSPFRDSITYRIYDLAGRVIDAGSEAILSRDYERLD